MTTHQDGWLTIREASISLGVSELTIRRRIKGGRVAHRLENGKYWVNLDVAAPAVQPPAPSDNDENQPATPHPGAAHGRPEVAGLLPEYGRLAERAGRAGALEEAVRRLEEQRSGLEQSLIALAGRNGWLESRLEERERDLKLLTDRQHKPSRWKRLFGARST